MFLRCWVLRGKCDSSPALGPCFDKHGFAFKTLKRKSGGGSEGTFLFPLYPLLFGFMGHHSSSTPPKGTSIKPLDLGDGVTISKSDAPLENFRNPSSISGALRLPQAQETLRPARGGLRNTPEYIKRSGPMRSLDELHAAASELPSHMTIGDYDVLGRLATGGMAEALLARHGDRPVVIKRLQSSKAKKHCELFRLEIERSLKLSHPNLAEGLCHFEFEGRDHLVLEWIYGVNLEQFAIRAQRIGGLPPTIAVAIVEKVAAALAFLHNMDEALVHCDVSPRNIMIGYDGRVVLLDLGVASCLSDLAENPRQLRGKLRYASPEQLLGKGVDARADLFSLGVTLYEALTGNALFSRTDGPSTVEAITTEPIPSVLTTRPTVSLALSEFLERAMNRDREHRFQTAEAFRSALMKAVKPAPHLEITRAIQGLFESELEAGLILDVDALHNTSCRDSGTQYRRAAGATKNTSSDSTQSSRHDDDTRQIAEPSVDSNEKSAVSENKSGDRRSFLSFLGRLFSDAL